MTVEAKNVGKSPEIRETPQEVFDCEIRDWEKFGALPQSTQKAVLEAIQSGKVPKDLLPLMKRLKEVGVVICT